MHCEESGERRQKTKSMIQRYKTKDSRRGCKLKEYQREPCDEYMDKRKGGQRKRTTCGIWRKLFPRWPRRVSVIFCLAPSGFPTTAGNYAVSSAAPSFFHQILSRYGGEDWSHQFRFSRFRGGMFSSFSSRLGWRVEHSE